MSYIQDDKLLSEIMHEIFGERRLQDPRNRFLLVKIKDSDEIGTKRNVKLFCKTKRKKASKF